MIAAVIGAHISKLTHGLSAADQSKATSSLGGALEVAASLPKAAGALLASGAEHAFVSGIHLAVITGAILCAIAAVTVYRFLPKHIAQHGAVHGPVEAVEDAAELGIAGVPPVFADDDSGSEFEPVAGDSDLAQVGPVASARAARRDSGSNA
jgi:DHA2 family multidrug resistance protein-like MFS transporter